MTPGSTVRLTIARPGQDKPIDVALIRDRITPRSVRAQVQGGDVGYIRVVQFNDNTGDELKKAIDSIAAEAPQAKLKGYVIDLRNNPGGVLDGAIAASDAFLEGGDIVAIGGRSAANAKHIRVKAGNLSNGKPVVVLINAGSASTAEVVAGALQDNHRATLIGTRSFGSGSVLTEMPLGHGQGVLRLATEQYFTPSGHAIAAKGISPDIEVTAGHAGQSQTGRKIHSRQEADLCSPIFRPTRMPTRRSTAPMRNCAARTRIATAASNAHCPLMHREGIRRTQGSRGPRSFIWQRNEFAPPFPLCLRD